MEIQFEQKSVRFLCRTAWGEKTVEETAEIKLPGQELSPEQILGAWGQPCLTEKQALSVLRVGYADGLLRRNPNGLLGAQDISKALCMDAAVVNGIYRRGRKVAVLSDAEEIAAATDTISYEVLCAATRRAEFVYAYE